MFGYQWDSFHPNRPCSKPCLWYWIACIGAVFNLISKESTLLWKVITEYTHIISLFSLLLKRKILVMNIHEDSVAHIERGSLLFKIQLNVSLWYLHSKILTFSSHRKLFLPLPCNILAFFCYITVLICMPIIYSRLSHIQFWNSATRLVWNFLDWFSE